LEFLATPAARATGVDVYGPLGSDAFGAEVQVLPNGNFVVTDPGWNGDRGRVALYDRQGNAISALSGGEIGDEVGSGGVVVLANGNYVVVSPSWGTPPSSHGGGVDGVGAVTWVNGDTGLNGLVSTQNSLHGSQEDDQVGYYGVVVLSNGNYVVVSSAWDNGGVVGAGAVTWANGSTGIVGAVTTENSLHGSQENDRIGAINEGVAVTALTNGNYVVVSPGWDNAGVTNAGAVTWGNGMTGITGAVSTANSLSGSSANDLIGYGGVTPLSNGNYVVSSSNWNNGVGAVTWGNGATGIAGVVSTANSLYGSQDGDFVGSSGVTALSNGNYVVASSQWKNQTEAFAGAVTWANGATGITGPVSTENSLYGTQAQNYVGDGGVTALTNGNYVVASYNWANGSELSAGAVTWGNGATGITGAVTAENSLVGSQDGDIVGRDVTALSNGHYVAVSPYWSSETAAEVGAVTWGNGEEGSIGTVSAANSLVGTQANDHVGGYGVTALANGNYVVASPSWDNGGDANVGAVTWGDGTTGTVGAVGPGNSLYGSQPGDRVGHGGVTALTDGNYVVTSALWDNGALADVGAVTWGSGAAFTAVAVSTANSLYGVTASDQVGFGGVTALDGGYYLVSSPSWDNGGIVDAGAITWGDASAGSLAPSRSVVGTAMGGGESMTIALDTTPGRCPRVLVGRPADNVVTLWPEPWCLQKDGFE